MGQHRTLILEFLIARLKHHLSAFAYDTYGGVEGLCSLQTTIFTLLTLVASLKEGFRHLLD